MNIECMSLKKNKKKISTLVFVSITITRAFSLLDALESALYVSEIICVSVFIVLFLKCSCLCYREVVD